MAKKDSDNWKGGHVGGRGERSHPDGWDNPTRTDSGTNSAGNAPEDRQHRGEIGHSGNWPQ